MPLHEKTNYIQITKLVKTPYIFLLQFWDSDKFSDVFEKHASAANSTINFQRVRYSPEHSLRLEKRMPALELLATLNGEEIERINVSEMDDKQFKEKCDDLQELFQLFPYL